MMNKLKEIYKYIERIDATNEMSAKDYIFAYLKSTGIVLFFTAPFHILIINTFVMILLYKSLWAILLGFLMIYFVVMCFWAIDKVFIRVAKLETLKRFKKEFYTFYSVLAVIAGLIGVIVIIIEVI